MSITTETCNLILGKAKNKKDGIYSFRGVLYRVRNNGVTHFITSRDILMFSYGFLVAVGKAPQFESERRKLLKTMKS